MPGFRRAQLRGSEELFRPTDDAEPVAQQEEIEVSVAGISPSNADEAYTPVPNAPDYAQRTVRLQVGDLQLLADAIQHMKFPGKTLPRPSVDEFERLEELRKALLDQI